MSRKFGQYYYAPHGRRWGIWLWKEFGTGGIGEFVKDCHPLYMSKNGMLKYGKNDNTRVNLHAKVNAELSKYIAVS